MCVGVVALCYGLWVLIKEYHNSHKHSQDPLTTLPLMLLYTMLSFVIQEVVGRSGQAYDLLTRQDWLLSVYYLAYVTAFQSLPPPLLHGTQSIVLLSYCQCMCDMC